MAHRGGVVVGPERSEFFFACLCSAFEAGGGAGLFGQGRVLDFPRFRCGLAGRGAHLAKNEIGERVGSADAEARAWMTHLLGKAVDERRGVDGDAGFCDQEVCGLVHVEVLLDRFGEEPVEEVGEGDLEFPGEFGEGSVAFEDVGEHVGGELSGLHGKAPVGGEEGAAGSASPGSIPEIEQICLVFDWICENCGNRDERRGCAVDRSRFRY